MDALRFVFVAAIGLISACVADPQSAAPVRAASEEAVRGRAYAEDACAGCHAIEAGALYSRETAAPTFEAIANTPGMTRIALSAWLQSAHPNMPQLIVDQDRVDDLWAYLSTLQRND